MYYFVLNFLYILLSFIRRGRVYGNEKSAAASDENLESAVGGFTQYDPGWLEQMNTMLTQREAAYLNEKLNLDEEHKFKAGIYYNRDEFTKRGIKSSSGEALADALEGYGFEKGDIDKPS